MIYIPLCDTIYLFQNSGRHGRDRSYGSWIWSLDLQLPLESVPFTTEVASSNRAQARCTPYNII